jgi:2-dehydro-3-deoxyphosphogluconate aldolase/(4S)-4-hydroxy-2-oxoglutarate aldolase
MIDQLIESTIHTIEKSGIVPVFYHDNPETCLSVAKACYQAGLRVFEFTNRGAQALQNFEALQNYKAKEAPDLLLGIGTILTLKDADPFLLKRASFVVSPALIPAMSAIQANSYTPWIPGCGTVSEVVKAKELGARLIKIFPGNVLGPGFASSLRAVLPEVKLMPTGGVEPTMNNLTAWFDAGVVAVGMGSQLFTKELIEKKDWKGLEKRIGDTIAMVNQIRK